MPDVFSPNKRSLIMSHVRGTDTAPELLVRSIVHRMGYRFRVHRRDLPGCPDIVLPRHHKIIFVHGCFWHGHKGCPRSKRPATHVSFWDAKLDANRARDIRAQQALREKGWEVLIVWQCQTRDRSGLTAKLERFLRGQ